MSKRFTLGVFIAFVCLSMFITAIEYYTQFVTYPVFALVGKNEFVTYSSSYEARLVLGLYIPWGLTLLANIYLWWQRPSPLKLRPLLVTFVLNLSILFVSLFLAVPIHTEDAARGGITPENLAQLLNINFLRLVIAGVSSGLAVWMLMRIVKPEARTVLLQ